MDNTRTIPGYKFHVDARTGERPAVFVTSLNIEPEDEGDCPPVLTDLSPRVGGTVPAMLGGLSPVGVNGLAFSVEEGALALFDARERQYHRREVTELVDVDLGGPVFAYFGRDEARERYERGRREGTAVVSREYHDEVRAGFALLGEEWLARYDASTEPPAVPLSDLRRIAVPPASSRPSPSSSAACRSRGAG